MFAHHPPSICYSNEFPTGVSNATLVNPVLNIQLVGGINSQSSAMEATIRACVWRGRRIDAGGGEERLVLSGCSRSFWSRRKTPRILPRSSAVYILVISLSCSI